MSQAPSPLVRYLVLGSVVLAFGLLMGLRSLAPPAARILMAGAAYAILGVGLAWFWRGRRR
jgi:hypothetical protein